MKWRDKKFKIFNLKNGTKKGKKIAGKEENSEGKEENLVEKEKN
jgi:hypothetical protein